MDHVNSYSVQRESFEHAEAAFGASSNEFKRKNIVSDFGQDMNLTADQQIESTRKGFEQLNEFDS